MKQHQISKHTDVCLLWQCSHTALDYTSARNIYGTVMETFSKYVLTLVQIGRNVTRLIGFLPDHPISRTIDTSASVCHGE